MVIGCVVMVTGFMVTGLMVKDDGNMVDDRGEVTQGSYRERRQRALGHQPGEHS